MSSKGKPTQSPYSQAIYTTVTPVIGGIVVVLNVFELLVIYKLQKQRKRKMSKSFIYVANLCISDILVGIVMIILKSMDPFMKTTLQGDVTAKEFYHVLKHLFIRLSMFISIFNLLAMTFDRYLAIACPLKHRKRGKSFTYKIIALVWFLSMACVTSIYCVSRFKLSNVEKYNNMVFPISAYPTIAVFLICYPLIYKVVKDSNNNDLKRGNAMQTNTRKNRSTTEQNDEKSSMRQEVKLLRIAVLTVGAFCVSWLPFSTCNLLIASGNTCGGKDVERTFFTLAFANSVINPLIYICCNMNGIKKIFMQNASSSRYLTVKTSKTSLSSENQYGRSRTTSSATSANGNTTSSTSMEMKNGDKDDAVLENEVFDEPN